MSVSGFLSSISDKAQTALNTSSISQHISPSIQHQFRQLQQNYSSTTPLQKIITAEKGVALDFETLSRDARSQSKEIYQWGQQEQSDVKDVSDRIAFLNYVAASLATTLSEKLNTARLPLKELRDNEVALAKKHNVCTGLEQQISRVENNPERGSEKRLAEFKEQLAKAQDDYEPTEKQHDILLRKALKQSELLKFQALREYGEKLALVAQAAESVLAILPSFPPSSSQPYNAVEETGSIRASLQYALDHWKPGQTTLSAPAEAILDRSNTGSFGVTHAAELQQIKSVEHQGISQPAVGGIVEPSRRDSSPAAAIQAPVPVPGSTSSPPSSSQTQPGSFSSPLAAGSTSSSINPALLNNEPALIPSASPPVAVKLPGSVDSEAKVPAVTPTVAETGVPVSGGPGGPGPSSGSLLDIRSSSSGLSQAASDVANTPVLEEGSTKRYESAEEEKQRLAREERERLLHGDTPSSNPPDEAPEDGETPPPYQDI
jgi:hypothetical protein